MKRFVKRAYLIDQTGGGLWSGTAKLVEGFAFETPGWPEFHACVRFDRRDTWCEKNWILDHYESGCSLPYLGLKSKEEAPAALAKLLESKGREKVAAALAKYGLPPASIVRGEG